jgi:hypothetical protein
MVSSPERFARSNDAVVIRALVAGLAGVAFFSETGFRGRMGFTGKPAD